MNTKHLKIIESPVNINLENYSYHGDPIIKQHRALKDISGIFHVQEALSAMDLEQTAYTVQAWMPEKEGTEGGLFFGTTNILPGKVGNEYFMTKGHFHARANRSEFYLGIQGEGMLLLMDRNRNTWAEKMFPGSLHYIPLDVAHRVANTGNTTLIFSACWPSDAGHDYDEIAKNGFSARLFEIDGQPQLIDT